VIIVNGTTRTRGRAKGTCTEAIKNDAVVINLVEEMALKDEWEDS